MEKRTAHYELNAIKAVVMKSRLAAFTATARQGARRMGLNESETLAVVLGLQPGMLFKSMTTHADHRVWQDVYHAPCANGKTAYIKITLQDGAVVIQFKEL
ncbi:MAG: type II toxin-antitoxin system MqsR family toxin [Methylococcaceae bacterium]|nr:MAG: type II toxin-antitoxin system MqsR family toxin [Methylococcaceae bacterium]